VPVQLDRPRPKRAGDLMTEIADQPVHLTPLVDEHRALGAKLIDFAGWLMPVQYSGILDEHRAVRERAGLFDLSHMGELFVDGPEAGEALAYALVTNPPALAIGRAHYSMIVAPDGGILDDLIVYRLGVQSFLVVANAGNAQLVSDTLAERIAGRRAVLDDRSLATALIAIQGPRSADILAPFTDIDLAGLKYYAIAEGEVAGIPALVARTGYTGEDGFELYFDGQYAEAIWTALMQTGEVTPAGLGSRDSLRLEMGMALYGNDIDDTTTPLEANLGWLVKLQKGEFVGKDALVAQKTRGLERKLIGFTTAERSFPRHGYPVKVDGKDSGIVRSGTMSPTLNIPIGTAYVPAASAKEGSALSIEIRGKEIPATVAKLPFYKSASHK
jgi:aminomethyltransferase